MTVHANPGEQLARQLKASGRRVSVTYVAGAVHLPIEATPAAGRIDLMTAEQLGLRARNRDWLIEAADLVDAGQPIVPATGHVIRHQVGLVVTLYRVSPLGDQGCYDPIDESGVLLRVHSQKVGTEAAT